MCLIVVGWKVHPRLPLIVAANRDEFHARPAAPADWWDDRPDTLGGRDLEAGGTWMAVTRTGRFGAVTNYREASFTQAEHRSRGLLVTGFLDGRDTAAAYGDGVDGDDYAGFNLLTADGAGLAYTSNRTERTAPLAPGVYGLSNASLDTPWDKVERSKARLAALIDADSVDDAGLLELLADRRTAPADADTESLPEDVARAVTAPFIVSSTYGTRCSTTLVVTADGSLRFTERRFDPDGETRGDAQFEFRT